MMANTTISSSTLENERMPAFGLAARDSSGIVSPVHFSRRQEGNWSWGRSTPMQEPQLPVIPSIMGRKTIAGSAGGGTKESQEMIDFAAAKHNITSDIEQLIPMDYVNIALERVSKNDVKYRFVIDAANTLHKDASAATS
ncbi:hypothetical protein K1719_017657 [Acacia pycnantha]|nr:hypothetical protein K1719_017657 [Acacia pycnantha]